MMSLQILYEVLLCDCCLNHIRIGRLGDFGSCRFIRGGDNIIDYNDKSYTSFSWYYKYGV